MSAAAAVRTAAKLPAKLWLLVLIGAIWEAGARIAASPFFPPPSLILQNYARLWLGPDPLLLFQSELFWTQASASLGRFAAGWALALAIGVAAGAVLAASRLLARMYNPIVRFFASIPNTILLPVAVQIFGTSSRMNIFLIVLGSVWVVIINTYDGIRGIDPMWLRSARSLRLRRSTMLRRIVLPAALPQIMAGMRVSLGIALILMVISELYATTVGLGHQVVVAQTSFRYLDMWSAFVVIGLVGIALNLAFAAIERRVLRWQRRPGLANL